MKKSKHISKLLLTFAMAAACGDLPQEKINR